MFFQVCCQIESFGISPTHSQTMRSCTPASVSLAESPAKRRGVKQHRDRIWGSRRGVKQHDTNVLYIVVLCESFFCSLLVTLGCACQKLQRINMDLRLFKHIFATYAPKLPTGHQGIPFIVGCTPKVCCNFLQWMIRKTRILYPAASPKYCKRM